MNTETLQDMAWNAEDAGKDVYIERSPYAPVIEYIEIDGVEHYNPGYVDEVKDYYWEQDAYRIADRIMR